MKENLIKQFREERKWTMQILADNCYPPTTASQINKLEKGKTQLSLLWMKRIGKAFDIEPLDLVGGNREQLSEQERKLLKLFRQLPKPQQLMFLSTALSLGEAFMVDDDISIEHLKTA